MAEGADKPRKIHPLGAAAFIAATLWMLLAPLHKPLKGYLSSLRSFAPGSYMGVGMPPDAKKQLSFDGVSDIDLVVEVDNFYRTAKDLDVRIYQVIYRLKAKQPEK